ncbi:MAG: hypothetical protein LC722_04030 [Actinobacteria bacterium]|nr:hypothetical protein [Actinomycetota bacterium]
MNHLPTGTVTFLFSDIEGSTRLLQAAGSGYQELLATHAGFIRSAASAHGGVEISTEGDSFFVVFPSPLGAVSAAAEAQRAITEHAWPEGMEVRVRMGLHTGEAELGGDNYAGIDVNRAARVASAAHGEQVLVSDATRALVERKLPPGVDLRDLGSFRLKDLPAPERLHQLVIDVCRADFPPPRTVDARPNNLPTPLTRFIDRDEVQPEILRLLRDARLLTLSGPGGTGKTRLALETARAALTDFEDGAFFVDLSTITDPMLVAVAIAEALGVPENATRPRSEVLMEHLAARELLLVLDNFEQVVDAAPMVGELLAAAPKLKVLATSRIVLHVAGEREFPVPPLELPDPAVLPDAEQASAYESVLLFLDRATAVKPDFVVTNDNAPAVAEICYRLDGLPLAIELAASRVKLLSPQAMLPRLEQRLELVTGGARDLPERQRTLRGAIAWSYDLLGESERVLFARLAAFNGGATLEDAEAVCNPGGELGIDMFDVLATLVDNSLLRLRETADGVTRFLMLETIREYAVERLAESADGEAVRRRHAEHFAAFAEAAESELTRGPEALDRCTREHDNIRAALRWAIDHGEASIAFVIGGALWRFFQQRGHLRDTLGDPLALANSLYNLSYIAFAAHDWKTMEAHLTESLAAAREAGDEMAIAQASHMLGYDSLVTRDYGRAIPILEEALKLYRRRGDRFLVGDTLNGLAQGLIAVGRLDEARESIRESIEIFTEADNPTGVGQNLYALGALAAAREDWDGAIRMAGASHAVREAVGGGAPLEIMEMILPNPESAAREHLDAETADRVFAEGLAMPMDKAVAHAFDEGSA